MPSTETCRSNLRFKKKCLGTVKTNQNFNFTKMIYYLNFLWTILNFQWKNFMIKNSNFQQCPELYSNMNAYKIRSQNTQECSLIMEAKNCRKFRENNYLCHVNVAVVRIFQHEHSSLKNCQQKNCVQDTFSVSVFEFDGDAWKCCNLKIIHNTWLLKVLNYWIAGELLAAKM